MVWRRARRCGRARLGAKRGRTGRRAGEKRQEGRALAEGGQRVCVAAHGGVAGRQDAAHQGLGGQGDRAGILGYLVPVLRAADAACRDALQEGAPPRAGSAGPVYR